MGASGSSDRVGVGASALAVDVLGGGIVCNHGTSVGDCPERVPAMCVPDGDPENGGHIGSLGKKKKKKKKKKKSMVLTGASRAWCTT